MFILAVLHSRLKESSSLSAVARRYCHRLISAVARNGVSAIASDGALDTSMTVEEG